MIISHLYVPIILLFAQCGFSKKGHRHRTHRGAGKVTKQPNIVFILADDLGFNDVPWHNPTIIAPHLSQLASTGVILEQNYVQPKCAPSRAALLTGRYPYHIGRQHESLPPSMPTGVSLKYKLLPQALKEHGYSTHAVGKWHLGYCDWNYTPTRRGFDTFFGFYTHGEDYYDRISSDSSKNFFGYDLRDNENVTHEGQGEYSAELFSRKAVEIIHQASDKKPLFLYLSFQSIHKPIQVPDKYARLYQPYGKLDKKSRRQGMISALDEAVKNVTAALRRTNKYRDTVIVFMSDNGGADKGSNWPLRGGKNSVWEGGTRSVAFVHYPRLKKSQRGHVSNELMHAVDWYPTILSMAEEGTGHKHSNKRKKKKSRSTAVDAGDGFSMWDSISHNRTGQRTELVYNINDALRFTAAIRSGRWKLIWGYPDGLRSNVERRETRQSFAQTMYEATSSNLLYLFDLEKDPNETVNLVKTERKIMKKLMKKVRTIIKSGEVKRPDTPFSRERSLPKYWQGVVSPGWCRARN